MLYHITVRPQELFNTASNGVFLRIISAEKSDTFNFSNLETEGRNHLSVHLAEAGTA